MSNLAFRPLRHVMFYAQLPAILTKGADGIPGTAMDKISWLVKAAQHYKSLDPIATKAGINSLSATVAKHGMTVTPFDDSHPVSDFFAAPIARALMAKGFTQDTIPHFDQSPERIEFLTQFCAKTLKNWDTLSNVDKHNRMSACHGLLGFEHMNMPAVALICYQDFEGEDPLLEDLKLLAQAAEVPAFGTVEPVATEDWSLMNGLLEVSFAKHVERYPICEDCANGTHKPMVIPDRNTIH